MEQPGNALNDGYGVETTLTGGAGNLARADAIKTYVDNIVGASDAMVFKGYSWIWVEQSLYCLLLIALVGHIK